MKEREKNVNRLVNKKIIECYKFQKESERRFFIVMRIIRFVCRFCVFLGKIGFIFK